MSKIPGKVNYIKQAALDMEISAGAIVDNQIWIPATQHQEYFGDQVVPYHQHVRVKIELDNVVMLDQLVGTDNIKFHHEFLDSETDCNHTLNISVHGIRIDSVQRYQNKDVFTLLKISNLKIENLPVQYILEQTGQWQHYTRDMLQYLGTNGSCALNFTTPIYSWLLSQDNWIHHQVADNSSLSS